MSKRSKRREATEQAVFFNRVNFGLPIEQSRLIIHIPNGEHRDPRTAVKLKQMGVRPGYPDIAVFIPRPPYAGLFIELKSELGSTSKVQNEVHEALTLAGFLVKVSWCGADAFNQLMEYLSNEG